MRVRILMLPENGDCDHDGFDVSKFEVGKVYEVGPRLGELLIVCGYAEPVTVAPPQLEPAPAVQPKQ